MNKIEVDQEIQVAYQALAAVGIAQQGKVKQAFCGQIASFGAAVTMGSMLSAIAFFSIQGNASVERQKLMEAVLLILKKHKGISEDYSRLFDYAKDNEEECKENIINAAIALKLAMNLYIMEK